MPQPTRPQTRTPDWGIWYDILQERHQQELTADGDTLANPQLVGGHGSRFLSLGSALAKVGAARVGPGSSVAPLRRQLVKLAATAVAWIEAIDALERAK